MMEEKNRKRLEEALAGLPLHEPRPDSWDKIEAFLDFEDRLHQALPELPEHEPSDLLWGRLEEELDSQLPVMQLTSETMAQHEVQQPLAEQEQKAPGSFRVFTMLRYAAAVAASVLLLLVGRYMLQQPQQQAAPKEHIAYSVEEVHEEPAAPVVATAGIGLEGLEFIQQQCSQLPDVCESPEFVELQNQLAQLNEQDRQLQQDLQLYGEDPMLVQSQIKIENLRAEITKELIQLIIS